jgi:hypothetical protein
LNDDGRIGLYSFSSDGSGDFERKTIGPYVTHGGVLHDGKYFYGMYAPYMGVNIARSVLLDVANRYTTLKEDNNDSTQWMMATAMANDPVTDQVYGCFYSADGSQYEFGIVDVEEFTRTTIATLNIPWEAAGFSSDGTLYVVLHTGELATVNLATGANTVIGQTGLPIGDTTSGTMDKKTNTFFFATATSTEHALYTINLSTATPTKLFDMPNGEQIGGMFIYYASNDAMAPDEVTNVSANFLNGSLEGSISFTAPSTTFNGTALSGSLTYDIQCNNSSIASGNCQPGAPITAPVTMNETGFYTFEVTVSNDNGTSVPAKVSAYVGKDAPMAPANVVFTADGLNFTVTWDAVTAAQHGGYLNAENITYRVTRYPDATVVAQNLTTTSFSETIAQPSNIATFYYTVEAVADGVSSEPGRSNEIVIGYIQPPYSEDFQSETSVEPFTIIDANNDGDTWQQYLAGTTGEMRAKYNVNNAANDWLITAPIRLEAGKIYDLTYDVRAFNASYKERYEVYMGTEPTVAGMTTKLVEPTVLTSKTYSTIAVPLSVEETGLYYVGFHAISDANMYYVCLDNLAISAPRVLDTPGTVTDFSVTPDYYGGIKGTVQFTTPTLSINGNALTSLSKVVVSRNGSVVHTFGESLPGQVLSFVDQASSIGQYSYTIVAYNDLGAGQTFSASARLGVNLLSAATNAAIEETTVGTVKMTWDAPTTDVEGFPVSPSVAHYAIIDKTGLNELAEDISSTEYTYKVTDETGKQSFVYYYIMTQSDAGVNYDDYTYTPQIAVGPAYQYPFSESFAGGSVSKAWGITRGDNSSASWGVGPSSGQPVAYPQDEDGGLAGFMPTAVGEEARFYSGKIAIPADAAAPYLSFYYYSVKNAGDELEAIIAPANSGNFTVLQTVKLSDAGYNGWTRVLIPLDDYKGQTVQIGFNGRCVSYQYLILIDNITVSDILTNNLTVKEFNVPEKATPGQTMQISATVANTGLNDAENFTVKLFAGKDCINSMDIDLLESGDDDEVLFNVTPSVFSEAADTYHVEVVWESDMDTADNASEAVTPELVEAQLPRVTDLTLTVDESGNGITLNWGEPDTTTAEARTFTEDFESAKSFALTVAGWTMVDGDKQETYGIEDATFTNNGKAMAYIVFDNTIDGLDDTFGAHSGNKYLASFANVSGEANDDWAISPRLEGTEQTISFYARSYTNYYGDDAFELLYSTTDTDTANFVKLGGDEAVPTDWTKYEFTLPEGARYFAIRYTSADHFIFMVDDVVYRAADAPEFADVLSYNVYRNSELVGTAAANNRTFADGLDLNATYQVTALFDGGESRPSNSVSYYNSGLNSVSVALPKVSADRGYILIENVAGLAVNVSNVSGQVLYVETGSNSYRLPVAPGVYLVKVGNNVSKLVVR